MESVFAFIAPKRIGKTLRIVVTFHNGVPGRDLQAGLPLAKNRLIVLAVRSISRQVDTVTVRIPKITGQLRKFAMKMAADPKTLVDQTYARLAENEESYARLPPAIVQDVLQFLEFCAKLWFNSLVKGARPTSAEMELLAEVGRRRVHQGVPSLQCCAPFDSVRWRFGRHVLRVRMQSRRIAMSCCFRVFIHARILRFNVAEHVERILRGAVPARPLARLAAVRAGQRRLPVPGGHPGVSRKAPRRSDSTPLSPGSRSPYSSTCRKILPPSGRVSLIATHGP